MINTNFGQNPKKLSKALIKNFAVEQNEQNGRKIWTISPKTHKSDVVIVYLHGGAYMANISKSTGI